MVQKLNLEFDNNALASLLFGAQNSNLTHIEKKLGVDIASRGNSVTVSGEQAAVDKTRNVLGSLWDQLKRGQQVGIPEIDAKLRFLDEYASGSAAAAENGKSGEQIVIRTKKKSVVPRSPNQARYIKAIQDHEMVFGLGPAGTGKTYLAVAVGVSMFLEGKVERLIFTRPAVEAGERLGFLPGDMQEKVDPYLRPIYDALQDMIPADILMHKMQVGEIEVAPLAFMRGRTLNNAFVILDEAQNTTCTQMKMFLTRMGEASRMVITGDITQTDLPAGIKSGLRDALEILENVEGISFNTFAKEDVIRHPLVAKIVHAYDEQKHKQDT